MKKLIFSSFYLGLTMLICAQLNAQFDDLYFDESDITYTENVQSDDQDYTTYDDAEFEAPAEAYDYDEDEYDEYLAYRDNDYAIDAYRYTNRLNSYRYSRFGVGYNNTFNNFNSFGRYGYSPLSYGSGINIVLGNNFNSFNRFGSGFGNSFYNPYSPFGFGASRFGGGFNSYGSAAYCPPYNPAARASNRVTTNNAVSRSASARTTSRVGSSTARTSQRAASSARSTTSARNATVSKGTNKSSSRSASATNSRARSSATSSRARSTNSRSIRPSSSSRSVAPQRSSSINRSSSTPSRSSSVRSSSGSSSRAVSRSSSSSRRGS